MQNGNFKYAVTALRANQLPELLAYTTPIGVSGYLATGGHISGSVLQIVNLGISLVMYYPFFRIWDNLKYHEEKASLPAQEAEVQAVTERSPT